MRHGSSQFKRNDENMDVKIEKNELIESSVAHINRVDLENNIDLIYLGCDMKKYNQSCQSYERLPKKYKDMKNPVMNFYHETLEEIITHEAVHIILYGIEGEKTCRNLDNIDFPTKRTISIIQSSN